MIMAAQKSNIGQLLLDSLTTDQIGYLLDVVANSGDLSKYMDDLRKVDPDMAATVGKILKAGSAQAGGGKSDRIASDQRTIELWDSLWRNWQDIVAKVGDEEGKYAVQDHHWEEPYFDSYSLALDLEPIAADMLVLVDDVYGLVDEPDLFTEALDEIEDNISFFPEWMGAEHGEGCELGKNATECVLKWLWMSSQPDAHPGIRILGKVLDIEASGQMVSLNPKSCVDFFTRLPDNIGREIYICLKDSNDDIEIDNIYSTWHQINLDYESRFNPAVYLETCRAHLSDNWRYGAPLIDAALDQGDFNEAESLLKKSFSSYLGRRKKATWYPETSLLIRHPYQCRQDELKKVAGLLETWAIVAGKLGNTKRRAAAELQAVILLSPEDWNAILSEYKKLIDPKVKKTIGSLFSQWKTEMAEQSMPYHMDSPKATDSWVHWLIDAELDLEAKRKWFLNKIKRWLEGLNKDGRAFKKQWRWLVILTKDLPDSKKLQKKYPTFYETILHEEEDYGDLLGEFRSRGLKKIKAGPCLLVAMDVWEKHLRRIMPDPANAYKSDYTCHAQWAGALCELNQTEYTVLIKQWRKKHNRRRNLWRDMKQAGLSV